MRGFGAPQAYLSIENILEEISYLIKKDPAEVRLKNLYGKQERNLTPYGQVFNNNVLPELTEQLLKTSDYWQRRKQIEVDNNLLFATSHTQTHLSTQAQLKSTLQLGPQLQEQLISQVPLNPQLQLEPQRQEQVNSQLPIQSEPQQRLDTKLQAPSRPIKILKGLSFSTCKFGISFTNRFLNQASSLVNVHLDGSVQVSTGVVEMGQGVNTKLQDIIARELGITQTHVQIMATSTEKNHNTAPTAASTGFDLNGSATLKAVLKIKVRLALLVLNFWKTGEYRELDEDQITRAYNNTDLLSEVLFENSNFYSKDKKSSVSLVELLNKAFQCRVSLGELAFYKTPLTDQAPFFYFTQGACVSEVAIDLVTGEVTIPRTDILMDLGKPAHTLIDRGQITGAYVQSLGWLLLESLCYSPAGELISHSPSTYKIPTANEIPKIWNLDFFKNETQTKNIYGSKAAGEPPYLLSFSVWLAIKEALSKYNEAVIIDLKVPATPEEIILNLRSH